jgi:YbbR domain-containing protein
MAAPSRFNKIGLQGRTGTERNTVDSYQQTVEFDIDAIASATEQDTGIPAPTGTIQVTSAWIEVETAEATAAVKTVDVGTTAGSGNWSFTLADAGFADLASKCIITYVATDA